MYKETRGLVNTPVMWLSRALLAVCLLYFWSGVSADTDLLQAGVSAYEKEDYPAAFNTLRPLADEGNETASYYIGRMYYSGIHVNQDYAKALHYWESAAANGNTHIQRWVGELYYDGKGTKVNYDAAKRWLSLAASSGNRESMNSYAYMLATCPDEKYRDGALALELALSIAENEKYAPVFDTLAAAYAELRDFDKALEMQRKALKMLPGNSNRKQKYVTKLGFYERKQPWRE